ncbi:saccharopine dehydrogenase NADP-binding domain-containing protein [Paraglaciecola sp.]|nr:saccharopine dehydrogenase NADP-binding domain-containing protein [Paraglaciecola sp.]MDB4281709.1 saccharopine dehydrogenase NADP-binding domain-containing protein [Paraglaciecola sp.]
MDLDNSAQDFEQDDGRDFDLIVFGATGFTGKLVAEYLAQAAGNTRWAIAGRDMAKLEAVRRALNKPDLTIVIADSDDKQSLNNMAQTTRVICSTVGPYARYGTALVEACAEAGTHYCDLTGEPQWMAEIFERIAPIAEETGARIVHCCGFDSVPFDLGVFVAQQTMQQRHGVYAREVIGRMGESSGSLSGGTIASIMLLLEQAGADPSVRALVEDPYCLYPAELSPGLDTADQMGIAWDDTFGSWTGPFLMAGVNTRVVRRSNALASLIYGADFQYNESQLCGNRGRALLLTAGLGMGMGALSFGPSRNLLKRWLPKPGEGPDAKSRERGFFKLFTHAKHPEDASKDVRIQVTGKRDPGYGATSRMLAESALCLAHDPLKVEGGIWTPASALGQSLVERLKRVDITFEPTDL